MSKWCFALALIMPAALVAQPTSLNHSIEQWDSERFGQHCRTFLEEPESSEGSLCHGFVLGFMAGVRAVQKSVAPTVDDETFSERATRTRVGSRLRRQSLDALPSFCLGADTALSDIVEAALAYLDAEPDGGDASVSDAVRRALSQGLPCDFD